MSNNTNIILLLIIIMQRSVKGLYYYKIKEGQVFIVEII